MACFLVFFASFVFFAALFSCSSFGLSCRTPTTDYCSATTEITERTEKKTVRQSDRQTVGQSNGWPQIARCQA